VLVAIDGEADRLGLVGVLAFLVCITAASVLAWRATRAGFRLVVRRLTLRLAFSYFLIGIVPIPLLALLLVTTGYLLALQFVGGRLRREVQAIAEETTESTLGVQPVDVRNGVVARSPLSWLPAGTEAAWASRSDSPKFVLAEDRVWLAAGQAPQANGRILLLPLENPGVLQRLADRTGYAVAAQPATESRRGGGYQIQVGDKARKRDPDIDPKSFVRPRSRPKPGDTFLEQESIYGVYLARPVATYGPKAGQSDGIVASVGRTSPRLLFEELSSNWVPGERRGIVTVVIGVLGGALLFVYLIALAVAFALVATITRNVNRMSRAAEGIARGDFSVRVNTKSRDQIGDLARSFDGMADSIQRLLVETARKERLEGEIAVARTIQQRLLPPASAELDGARVLAHVQSVAEIGGDYYDYLPVPDGRLAIAVGDVSGHGLPTGLLVAMAKAALATLIETGLTGSPLFTRLNELIYRSTDSRSYMTLALFVYDSSARRGELTNAGQLAPYRISNGKVESLSLPSFPLGASARSEFPTRAWEFAREDRLVLLTDGLVECASPAGDPFGFERFEAILSRESGSPPEALRAAILGEVEAHTGGAPPDDDRTLVIVTLD
jgi:serine phosphatase RsbU (regulator of sigma subunit)